MSLNHHNRVGTIDALRGIASLAVCWFHLTNGNPKFLPDGLLKTSGSYGWLGVEAFFVISGFVIPYSLHKSGYMLKDYPRFLYKRIVRLDPPYMLAIVLILILGYLSNIVPGYKGAQFEPTATQVLLHLGYLNVFFDYAWLNPVFWTLAIEFQYYILIGLMFPLIASKRSWIRWGLLIALGIFPFLLPSNIFLFHYMFLFALGILAYFCHCRLIMRRTFIVALPAFCAGLYLTMGAAVAVIGVTVATMIVFVSLNNSVLNFFGAISYSLYLLHVPLGGRVINIGDRDAESSSAQVITLLVALGISVVASCLFYRFVERPSQQWCSSIKYNRRKREPRESYGNVIIPTLYTKTARTTDGKVREVGVVSHGRMAD